MMQKIIKYFSTFFIYVTALVLISSCSSRYLNNYESRVQVADKIAVRNGFEKLKINSATFPLAAYVKIKSPGARTVVYIEGDGLAYITSKRPSSNPTPVNPVALRIAVIDSSPNVIYLARPYQYFTTSEVPKDHVKYWTSHRFSEEILKVYEEALDKIVDITGSQDIHLVGYSGGAAVAAILASKRAISSLRTIAGYLDHVSLNRTLNFSPLFASLDPINVCTKIM